MIATVYINESLHVLEFGTAVGGIIHEHTAAMILKNSALPKLCSQLLYKAGTL